MSPWEQKGSQAVARQYLEKNGDDKLAKCQVKQQCEEGVSGQTVVLCLFCFKSYVDAYLFVF